MKRNSRHDSVALARQKNLAALLILANLFVGAALALVMTLSDWSPGLTSFELIVCCIVFGMAWLALVVAGGFVEWLPRALPSAFPGGLQADGEPSSVAAFIARRRMVFYYAGVVLDLLAIAVISQVTGGLPESPFVALLIAFVLTGQQLSRFRTQSGILFVLGIVTALLMLIFEPFFSKPEPPAPPELEIAAVLLALATGGVLNYFEKSHNYLLERHVHRPSHVRIYEDGRGIWRYSLYRDFHRQDPVLFPPGDPAVKLDDGEFPPGLKERFEELAKAMGSDASWDALEPDWPERCEDSFAMRLVVKKDVAR